MKRSLINTKDLRQITGIVLLLLVYFATAKIGLGIDSVNNFATLIWPPSGIALAALFLYGYELWPGVALAAFFVNLSLGAPAPVALGIAAGNTLQALVGAYFLHEYMDFNPLFSRLRDSFAFILTSFCSTVIAASVGGISLYLGGQLTQAGFAQTWATWWTGDSLGILIVGAFGVRWLYRPLFHKTPWEVIEGLLVFGSLVVVTTLIFWTPLSSIGNVPLLYVLFIPLIWAALRTGPRGMTLALLLISFVAVASLFSNHGDITFINNTGNLLLLQIFIGTVAIIFLLFVSIVEERKEAVVSLRDHINKLEEVVERIRAQDEAKNEFIATLGHELRNPLSPIISAVELMRRQETGVNQKLVGVIESHTQTMARLLDDLLDISRITRKKFKLQKEVLELQSVVSHAQETVTAFLEERNHTFLVSMPKKSIYMSADKVRLEQIFINLLFNAAKYTEPGGTITLTLSEMSPQRLRISVKDTGIGIDKNMLSRIFEPFVQASLPQGSVGSGLGIGLSLTQRLAELHGGTIRAESAGRGKGSEFIVELPLSPHLQLSLPQVAPASFVPRATVGGPKYPKILVVDDNEAAAQGLGALLKHLGHEIEFAYDGPGALVKIKEFSPDVVLLDIGLPGMDGYQVAKQVRKERSSSLMLIALSGYGQDEDKRKAREVGFNHHLTKPVGIRDLEQLLAS